MLLSAVVGIGLSFSYILRDNSNKELAALTNVADPELTGPDRICNIFGSVVGTFSGGGDPATDVYKWTILAPDGSLLFTRPPGSFPNIEYTFELLGTHKVKLEVSRGGKPIADLEKEVDVIKGPVIALTSTYNVCPGQSIELQAISPASSNFSNYIFEWKNESNQVVGTANMLTVSTAGTYSVTFYFPDDKGNPVCNNTLTTKVSVLNSISIIQSASTVCKDGSITFTADPISIGRWFLKMPGEPNRIDLGNSSSVTLLPEKDLMAYGEYSIELIIENENNPSCIPQAISIFNYNEQPAISVSSVIGSSGCLNPDGGLELIAETNLDLVRVGTSGSTYGPFLAGETIVINNLKSGGYTLYSFLNGCQNTLGAVVPLNDPPSVLKFEIENITAESCTTNGKINGSFDVNLENGIIEGSFRVINEKGDVALKEALPTANPFKIELGGGKYFFEILDKDSCNLPTRELIEIPSKPQTSFSIPDSLTICGSFELIPETSQILLFTLTDPSGNISTAKAGDPLTLTEAGEYSVIGTIPDQSEICPSERKLFVSTTEPIAFEPKLKSEDCVIGNRVYEADINGYDPSLAEFFWRNSDGDTIGTGQTLFLSPTSNGLFSLEVQPKNSENCPISPKEFTVNEPVLFVDASIVTTKLCEFGPEARVELITTSPEAVTDIRWRRFNEDGEIVLLPEFNNQTIITTRIGGTYEASAYSILPEINKNCELGRTTFQLDLTPDKVQFDIPEVLAICDYYELVPQTNQDLEFFLTTPSGAVIEKNSGQSFTIDEAGVYIFLAFDRNSPTTFCPEQKEMNVTLAETVDFTPILSEEFCDGKKIFQASVSNYSIDDVDISWLDENGNEVGTDEFFMIDRPGIYSLEVQPSNIIPCHISPISFEVLPPVLALDVMLLADPLCPDSPSATIRAEADFSMVTSIEWWYTFPTGEQIELAGERNKEEILAIREGTYEVRIYNDVPCILGFDQVLILRSTDTVRPEVEESYQVCPKYDIGPTINPGSFASYEWYFEDQLVSTNSVYKPQSIGNYRLLVYSAEGCAYQTDFITEEECELKVIYPNAVQPDNPDKQFLIYTNYLIDELDLVIVNKWGQVIFECTQTNLISEESTCAWDGTYNGKAIPNGNYAVRINFKNYQQKISKSDFGSILIIE
ncbi:gliding motility-associated C-terminal domain-containing protein [Algoriphagus winogradskyi]|uniref:C-terminal domain of CHU protein family protein n=1 Tax=Algoriphagus winogradskyi TaxID=237017 RepID=A0ABY1P9Z0_9BACT|nr:gliding motility-associated C-terminal domain-containing protein [Algoriphagus winogradskyi]SMP28598.1 C-terminal domain of CHU protein family protein [Algoriphagus winogradskyi]